MTSYPKNVQFTNVKVNSDQDLFLIEPSIPTDDIIMNKICTNQCIPTLDLIPVCSNILAALKVNGSAVICKGLNIGNTDTKISGTMRFNGINFEGYNGMEWIRLDCCNNMNGADYAEFFESKLSNKIPLGKTIYITDDGYINLAENGCFNEHIIGVVSTTYNIIGNSYDEYWHGKYERNKFGEIIYENHTYTIEEPVFEEKITIQKSIKKIDDKYIEIDENIIEKIPVMEEIEIYNIHGKYLRNEKQQKKISIQKTEKKKKISKIYDPHLKYIPRKDRPEWNIIGLVGQVLIEKGQPTNKNWIKIKDMDENIELWLIK